MDNYRFYEVFGKSSESVRLYLKIVCKQKRCLKLPLQFTEIIGFSRVKMLGVLEVSLEKNNGKWSKCWYILVAQSAVYAYCHFHALITVNGKGQQ